LSVFIFIFKAGLNLGKCYPLKILNNNKQKQKEAGDFFSLLNSKIYDNNNHKFPYATHGYITISLSFPSVISSVSIGHIPKTVFLSY
jgi:hypothetical protein